MATISRIREFQFTIDDDYQEYLASLNRSITLLRRRDGSLISAHWLELLELQEKISDVAAAENAMQRLREGTRNHVRDFKRKNDTLRDLAACNVNYSHLFQHMLVETGRCADDPAALGLMAPTTSSKDAYQDFALAMAAFRRGLYRESLAHVLVAIGEDADRYAIEWRFHFLNGVLRLGFVGCDMHLIDCTRARDAFLEAARFAKRQFPREAAIALMLAGWASYCHRSLDEAENYTRAAIENDGDLQYAYYQLARIQASRQSDLDKCENILWDLFENDRRYLGRALAEDDLLAFRGYIEQSLCRLIESCRLSANHAGEQTLSAYLKLQSLMNALVHLGLPALAPIISLSELNQLLVNFFRCITVDQLSKSANVCEASGIQPFVTTAEELKRDLDTAVSVAELLTQAYNYLGELRNALRARNEKISVHQALIRETEQEVQNFRDTIKTLCQQLGEAVLAAQRLPHKTFLANVFQFLKRDVRHPLHDDTKIEPRFTPETVGKTFLKSNGLNSVVPTHASELDRLEMLRKSSHHQIIGLQNRIGELRALMTAEFEQILFLNNVVTPTSAELEKQIRVARDRISRYSRDLVSALNKINQQLPRLTATLAVSESHSLPRRQAVCS